VVVDERRVADAGLGGELDVLAGGLALERHIGDVVFLLLGADVGVAADEHRVLPAERVPVDLLAARGPEREPDPDHEQKDRNQRVRASRLRHRERLLSAAGAPDHGAGGL
jgi:hypothetical protein